MPFITDSGLDNIAAYGIGSGNVPAYISYLALGDGSLSPSISTTALANQIFARTNSSGGFSVNTVYTLETGYFKRLITYYRVVDFTASYNLTEWGLAPSTSANLSVVDRFRDDENDTGSATRVISVQSGDQLQLIIEEESQVLGRGGTSVSFNITTDGSPASFDATTLPFYKTNAIATILTYVFQFFDPHSAKYLSCIAVSGAGQTGESQMPIVLAANGKTMTGDTYVNGTFERIFTASFTTSEVNDDIYGFVGHTTQLASNAFQAGAKVHFDSPTNFTKTSLQNLYVPIKLLWDRG